jgi:signal peptidase II
VLKRPAAVLAAVLAAVVFLDQVSKALVRELMSPPGTTIPLLGPVLRLTYVRNAGAAFGMLPGNKLMFVTIALLVMAGIAAYWYRVRPRRAVLVVALGLFAGGALGNLADRVSSGLVTDFIQVPFGFPVFNLADSCISVGVTMLMWWLLFGPADHTAASGAVVDQSPVVPAAAETPADGEA